MKTKTEQILTVMTILAWVALVGFLIEAGAILFNYAISWLDPEVARNLYRGMDLYALRNFSFRHYSFTISFIVSLSLMKALTAFLVTKTLSKFNLRNPFTMEVAGRLEQISYVVFGMWLVVMLSNAHVAWLLKKTGELYGQWISGEFIFMTGVIYVISQIFKRGVEIQSENELTV